jgi:hypothetical protein
MQVRNYNFHQSGLKPKNKNGRRHITFQPGTAKVYSVRLRTNHRDSFSHRFEAFMGATNDLWPQRDPRTEGPGYFYPRSGQAFIARL